MQRAVFVKRALATLLCHPEVQCHPEVSKDGRGIEALADIERRTGGRLGVAAIDTATGRSVTYRAHERFPMCSTFKVLAAAAILTRVDSGRESLQRHVAYSKRDLLEYAPVTRAHVTQGFMKLGDLCAAAIEYSDNTAANLLLAALGGPGAVTQVARTLGDEVTRLDRTEPALNSAIPGDPRDTTAPAAMASNLRKLVVGNALSPSSRAQLRQWMMNCRTGGTLLRAGLPASWHVGDKTGMGGRHNAFGDSDTRNDIAVVWPPARKPIVLAVYLTGSKIHAASRDAAIASVGRTITGAICAERFGS